MIAGSLLNFDRNSQSKGILPKTSRLPQGAWRNYNSLEREPKGG
jgi:hypothetical protein